jgi:hypothetical protein
MTRYQKFEKKKKNFHALIRASSHENLPFFKNKSPKKKEKDLSVLDLSFK